MLEPKSDTTNAEIQPDHRTGCEEHICELRKNCTVLYGMFVDMLRTIYSTKEGREFCCPDVLWIPTPPGKPNDDKSTVWIDTELRWEDKHPDKYPAIYVNLGQQQSQPILGEMHSYQVRGGLPFGESGFARRVQGQASLVHVATTAGAAYGLADNTEKWMTMLSMPLQKAFNFRDLRTSGRVPVQKMESSQSNGQKLYSSVVTVDFAYEDWWLVKDESPILKKVATTIISKAADSEDTVLAGGTIDGRQDRLNRGNIQTEQRSSNVHCKGNLKEKTTWHTSNRRSR